MLVEYIRDLSLISNDAKKIYKYAMNIDTSKVDLSFTHIITMMICETDNIEYLNKFLLNVEYLDDSSIIVLKRRLHELESENIKKR